MPSNSSDGRLLESQAAQSSEGGKKEKEGEGKEE